MPGNAASEFVSDHGSAGGQAINAGEVQANGAPIFSQKHNQALLNDNVNTNPTKTPVRQPELSEDDKSNNLMESGLAHLASRQQS